MSQRLRSCQAILAVVLLAGCSATPIPTPTPVATPTPTLATAARTPAPSINTAAPATATPAPATAAPTIIASSPPSPVAPSASPDTAATWRGITWRKLAADDPVANLRTMTRWRGGYVALGEPAAASGGNPTAIDEPVHTRVWVSADGVSWDLLDPDVLGPSTIVLGVGATADGIAALTVQAGTAACDSPLPLECWNLIGPLESWTSTDGTTWAPHPGPGIKLPSEMNGQDGEHPSLQPMTAPALVVTQPGQPLAISRDGIAWELVPDSAFPTGWSLGEVAALGPSLVALGWTPAKGVALTSRDGRVWTSHALPAGCAVNEALAVGSAGLIATGIADGGMWSWCSSLNGRTWTRLPGLPPLGRMPDEKAQECWKSCPNGSLRSDGERMVAYRGWGKQQVGWTSLDGRTWVPLAFTGRPEKSTYWLDDECTGSLHLLPIGLRCFAADGSTWFGAPES